MTPIICFSRSEDKFILRVTPPVQGANESAELVNDCWLGRAAPVFAWLVGSAGRPRSVSVDIKTDTPSPPQFHYKLSRKRVTEINRVGTAQ